MKEWFRRFSARSARALGSVWAFVATVVAFLMVFVIQNTQNRDTRAMQLKLNELIRDGNGTRKELLRLEDLSDGEIRRLRDEYRALARDDAGTPDDGPTGEPNAPGASGSPRSPDPADDGPRPP